MPIVTFEDEKLLARLDLDVAKQYDTIVGRMVMLAKEETRMGEMYQAYTKDLQILARRMRDKMKQMEVLNREDRSGVSDEDIKDYKERVSDIDDRIKALENYYDALKDLGLQKKGIIARLSEYVKMIKPFSKMREDLVDLGLRIDKEKNKMVAADSLSKLEDRLKDKQREFDRMKNEIRKKWEQVSEERNEVNGKWRSLKDCIEGFE